MCRGFKSRRRRHMWVEFVGGSLTCSESFSSGYSCFPLSSKTNISVVVNFLFQLIFIFPLFLGMVMYANEFKTKEKQKLTEIKN